MNEEQKAAFQKLEDSGYLPRLREFAMSKCAPFFWSSQEAGQPPKILHNGTICYVRTGQRDIAITANHVYQKYLDDLERFPSVEAQFGGSTIYPERRLIDRDARLDLATFDVPEVFVTAGAKAYHTPASWPPPPLKQGELVLYGGCPGALREPDGRDIVWPFQSFTWLATEVTDVSIALHVDFQNLFWPGHENERINENPGGISGGPVFRVIEDLQGADKRVYLELAGIAYEYYDPWETVLARHIRHVSADGSLVRV
jgi:hypothetical protein